MGIVPRRGRTNQPRASPWNHQVRENSSPERAAQCSGDGSPFQGSGIHIRPAPRTLPWADLWLPLRGERPRYRYSCYSLHFSRNSAPWQVGRPRCHSSGRPRVSPRPCPSLSVPIASPHRVKDRLHANFKASLRVPGRRDWPPGSSRSDAGTLPDAHDWCRQ